MYWFATDLYGGAYRLFTRVLPRYNIRFTFVDMTDLQATRAGDRIEYDHYLDGNADQSVA